MVEINIGPQRMGGESHFITPADVTKLAYASLAPRLSLGVGTHMADKRKVYLGTVAVVPRADLKRHLERPMQGEPADAALQSHLESVLSLSKAPSGEAIGANDCALDVFVAKHQSGEAWDFSAGDFGFPLLWRPAVEVSSRLYSLRSKKAITTLHVKKRLAWSEYLNRTFSLRGYFSFRSPFTQADMVQLLDEALIEVLGRIKARV